MLEDASRGHGPAGGRTKRDDLFEIVTGQSRWLFDTEHRRFQRWPRDAGRPRAAQFGCWRTFESLEIHSNTLLVVMPVGEPAIRVHIPDDEFDRAVRPRLGPDGN